MNEMHFGSSGTRAFFKYSGPVTSPLTSNRILGEIILSANDVKTKEIQNFPIQCLADCVISAKDVSVKVGNIGLGSFGTVHRGFWYTPVAMKEINVSNQCPDQTKALQLKVAVLRKIR